MPTLTIRSVPEELHARLRGRAERSRRSLNAETLYLLEQALETLPEEAELRARFRALVKRGPEPTRPEAPMPESALPAVDAGTVKRLLRDHREHLRAFGVRKIGLFGSVLRGEGRSDSDVDLLVEFDPATKSFDAFVHLAAYLEDLLEREVDLLTTEGLSPYIGPRILEEVEFVRLSD